jgi:Sigma-70 factor, region 1.2
LYIYRRDVYHRRAGYLKEMAAIDLLTHESEIEDAQRRDKSVAVLSTAELAECTCPDWCERDHDRD